MAETRAQRLAEFIKAFAPAPLAPWQRELLAAMAAAPRGVRLVMPIRGRCRYEKP